MKKLYIFFALFTALFFTDKILGAEKVKIRVTEQEAKSFAQKVKRSIEKSDSKDWGNLLLFLTSLGLLIYLPKHLEKHAVKGGFDRFLDDADTIDKIIRYPRKLVFGKSIWPGFLYYELLTLLMGYICCKTGKPYWEKLKKN